ncbi:hypothetical protein [Psychrobium sp. 1_MG-2023]|uniref:hypothetical protein n=1 Tax=Psychrobium sp. 1_MG-2023 TaxID=3062624 RepID=UPI000C339290|nr:hypothetical protein [Psychrobium sp. 1_MG-2023]MDP2562719.1 hypothetical protein [Psychrobium sp. 1_MG-2023]PKF54018.1 hypothetical protein CW748_17165 [Alteromonadales bacterium alter-6D02]
MTNASSHFITLSLLGHGLLFALLYRFHQDTAPIPKPQPTITIIKASLLAPQHMPSKIQEEVSKDAETPPLQPQDEPHQDNAATENIIVKKEKINDNQSSEMIRKPSASPEVSLISQAKENPEQPVKPFPSAAQLIANSRTILAKQHQQQLNASHHKYGEKRTVSSMTKSLPSHDYTVVEHNVKQPGEYKIYCDSGAKKAFLVAASLLGGQTKCEKFNLDNYIKPRISNRTKQAK